MSAALRKMSAKLGVRPYRNPEESFSYLSAKGWGDPRALFPRSSVQVGSRPRQTASPAWASAAEWLVLGLS